MAFHETICHTLLIGFFVCFSFVYYKFNLSFSIFFLTSILLRIFLKPEPHSSFLFFFLFSFFLTYFFFETVTFKRKDDKS